MIIKLVLVGDSSATESEIVLTAAMNYNVVRTALLSSDFKISGSGVFRISQGGGLQPTLPLPPTLPSSPFPSSPPVPSLPPLPLEVGPLKSS